MNKFAISHTRLLDGNSVNLYYIIKQIIACVGQRDQFANDTKFRILFLMVMTTPAEFYNKYLTDDMYKHMEWDTNTIIQQSTKWNFFHAGNLVEALAHFYMSSAICPVAGKFWRELAKEGITPPIGCYAKNTFDYFGVVLVSKLSNEAIEHTLDCFDRSRSSGKFNLVHTLYSVCITDQLSNLFKYNLKETILNEEFKEKFYQTRGMLKFISSENCSCMTKLIQ